MLYQFLSSCHSITHEPKLFFILLPSRLECLKRISFPASSASTEPSSLPLTVVAPSAFLSERAETNVSLSEALFPVLGQQVFWDMFKMSLLARSPEFTIVTKMLHFRRVLFKVSVYVISMRNLTMWDNKLDSPFELLTPQNLLSKLPSSRFSHSYFRDRS